MPLSSYQGVVTGNLLLIAFGVRDIDFAAMAKELQGNNAADYFGESFIYAEAMVTALRMARKGFRGTGKNFAILNFSSDFYPCSSINSSITIADLILEWPPYL